VPHSRLQKILIRLWKETEFWSNDVAVTIQPTPAPKASEHLIALSKKINTKATVTRADLTHATKILNDHKNTERAGFVALLQANENKTEDVLSEALTHTRSRPKQTKAGRPKGSTAEDHQKVVLLAWRLKLRGFNTVQVGERLNVSNQTAGDYIREAKELLRIDPAKVDIPTVVGESLNIYDHVSEMALQIAVEDPDAEVRLKAMAIVLKTQSDRNYFLVKVGILAPEVAEYFQQIVIQQNMIAGKKQDPMDNFFHSLATELLEAANPKGAEPAAIEGELHQGGVGG
jgi:hypothetical protein